MANGNPESEGQRPIQRKQSKKPYTKPAFRLERVFETQALSCGKIHGGTQGQCRTNRKAS